MVPPGIEPGTQGLNTTSPLLYQLSYGTIASFASANLRVILLLAKGRADFLLILSKTKVVEGEGLGKGIYLFRWLSV